MEIVARHGDVDVFRVSKLPDKLKLQKGTTIALGEATGHHHTLVPADVATQINVYVDELLKKTYFDIKSGKATLTHQEHKPITLEPGVYTIEIEEGYDYYTETIRKVMD